MLMVVAMVTDGVMRDDVMCVGDTAAEDQDIND